MLYSVTMRDSLISGVYTIYSEVNGRKYVGSAVDIRNRWSVHEHYLRKGNHHCQHLQRAWNKYGEGAFAFIILEECEIEDLIEREQHYIDAAFDLYNCNPVAGSCLGRKHTPETRAKISAAMSGRVVRDETKAKMSAAMMGNKNAAGSVRTDETRTAISDTLTGYKHTDEAKENMSASAMGNKNAAGYVHTDEAKAKIGAASRGNTYAAGHKHSDETKARMSASHMGHEVSEETRAKISAAALARSARKREEEPSTTQSRPK